MGQITESRRRQIQRKGRIMRLMTGDKSKSVSLMGYAPPPTVATIDATLPVQAFIAQILNDELSAAGYGPPLKGDRLFDGVREYTLTDASPVYDGADLCGWTLMTAGGT
ncbi:MAG: hypothetical protein ABF459_02170 [Gluconobacter cerinus]|uniref:hypothetical protein n=1 Tax=Gluconobacter cerinus TaxID=38307 RepID=UPI0039EBA79E